MGLSDDGTVYLTGGVDKDTEQAREYLAIAAEKGDDVSQYLLAEIYNSGTGVLEDDQQAAVFINKVLSKAMRLRQAGTKLW